MALLKIEPSSLQGSYFLPPSKSHTMRGLVFGAMGEGQTKIHNYLDSLDTLKMVEALRQLGVIIHQDKRTITLQGTNGLLKPPQNPIDAGNSGQVFRFIGALSALIPLSTTLSGDLSIQNQRPIQPLLSALEQLNAKVATNHPFTVRGPIQPGFATLTGEDSQPISALLIATSFLKGVTNLKVINPGEKPWIDLTLHWLKKLGGDVTHCNYENYTIRGPLTYKGFEETIPSDFSAAAFPLVGALVTGSTLVLKNLNFKDVQGDKQIIDIVKIMGGDIVIEGSHMIVRGETSSLKGQEIDVNGVIDALPILAVLGCFARGKTYLYNGKIARKKESDRIKVMVEELRKMGGEIEEREDGMIISPKPLKGAFLSSHGDHRVAMALFMAAKAAHGKSFLSGHECISKSYPSFLKDFHHA